MLRPAIFMLLLTGTVCANEDHFVGIVAPFVNEYCAECHGGDDPSANLDLTAGTIRDDFRDIDQVATWQNVLEQLTLGAMPPPNESQPTESQPTDAQTRQVKRWIVVRLKRVGQTPNVDHKLRAPEFGNYVNHERLFDGSQTGPAFSPARLWRLSPSMYNEFVDSIERNLRRETAIHQPFPLDERKGVVADFAAQNFADDASLQLLMMNCKSLARFQTTGILKRDHNGKPYRLKRTPPEFEQIITADEPPSVEQIELAIEHEYRLLLDRSPADTEMKQLVSFCQRAIATSDNVRGLQTTLAAILLKPEAVYRMEIGLGEQDEHGRRRLAPVELAFALARALTDSSPAQIELALPGKAETTNLLKLAMKGRLETPAKIRRVVIQIMNNNNMSTADYRMFTEDHQVRNTQVLQFFRDFFGYHHAPKVFKDAKRIGHGETYDTERIVNDADQLVMHIFDEDRDVLRTLLTTDKYFVSYLGSPEHIDKDMHYIKTNVNDANFEFNSKYVRQAETAGRHPIPIEGPDTRKYVGFYNLDHETWDYPTTQPFQMPEGERVGILTHPAWLIAWSGNFDNDPIRRGKWIRDHLLAGTIPDVPLDVNAAVPEDSEKSLRDRLAVTRDDYCWQCHEKMDPLGLPFEQYDDFGRHRKSEMIGELLTVFPERHKNSKTVKIDTSGHITDSQEASLDGNVADVSELAHRLAKSPRVRQSFVRHAFRFWMGRNETLDDSPTLIAADAAYVASGGSMKSMIASILSSDSFLYRK